MAKVKRAFADIAEGQVHYWISATPLPDKTPLLVLHPGPGTARIQLPLLEVLAETRTVIAPDLMGMGDSAPPPFDDNDPPEIDYYADSIARFLDTLHVDICDIYASSLGGRVAIEFAVSRPKRLRRLMLGLVRIIKGDDLEAMAQHHAPKIEPDQSGTYIHFLWSRLRDLYTYFPWFRRTADTMHKVDLPPAQLMHIAFVEQVKMAPTAHKAFSAYYRYPVEKKLGEIKCKTLVGGEDIAKMIPDASNWVPALKRDPLTSDPKLVATFAKQMVDFLDK